VDGRETEESPHLRAHTDVASPSAPILLVVRCYNTGQIYVEWRRPETVYNQVDSYRIFHRRQGEGDFSSVTVRADEDVDVHKYLITKLAGSQYYVVKVGAATNSLYTYRAFWSGSSEEKKVFLPAANCSRTDINLEKEQDDDDFSVGVVTGVILAAGLLLLTCCLFAYWRARWRSSYYSIDDIPRALAPTGEPAWEDTLGPDGRGARPVTELEDHVRRLHADSDAGFAREYEEIQKFSIKECQTATHTHCGHPDNKAKNRYLNIVACEYNNICIYANTLISILCLCICSVDPMGKPSIISSLPNFPSNKTYFASGLTPFH